MKITESAGLIEVVQNSEVAESTAQNLKDEFLPFYEKAEEYKAKALAIKVDNEFDKAGMDQARELRLELRDIRVAADKTRKKLKEDSVRYGKAVQGIYNVIDYLIRPLETHLKEQEDYAKIKLAQAQARLKEERDAEVEAFKEFIPAGMDLSVLSIGDYEKVLNGARMQHAAKIEAEEKARKEAEEKERLKRLHHARRDALIGDGLLHFMPDALADLSSYSDEEFEKHKAQASELKRLEDEKRKQEQAEAEKQRKENERLRKENAAAEEKRKKEIIKAQNRAKREAEAKFKKEQEQREKEARAKQEAEEKKRAAMGEDDKLREWLNALHMGAQSFPKLDPGYKAELVEYESGKIIEIIEKVRGELGL